MFKKQGALAVGNYDSNVGYAWRLMEHLWCLLAQNLSEKNYEMHVCFPTISIIPQCLKDAGFQVDQVDFTKSAVRNIIEQCIYIKKNNIKIIYFTDFKTFSLRYFIFKLVGVKKIIIHDHTPGLRDKPVGIKKYFKFIFARAPLISCDAAFSVSPYIYKRLITVNCIPEEKVYLVTNGVKFSDVPLTLPKNSSDVLKIVTVARATYYKGIDFAIRVVKELVKNNETYGIKYILYGDGPDLPAFQQLVRDYSLEYNIELAGAVDNVPELLDGCDIAFHPSKGEAMSLAILEYMRAGLPVVASDNPSVSSSLVNNEYALLYSENSIANAVEKLKMLIDSSALRFQIGSEARRRTETNFSQQAMSARFVAAINAVIP